MRERERAKEKKREREREREKKEREREKKERERERDREPLRTSYRGSTMGARICGVLSSNLWRMPEGSRTLAVNSTVSNLVMHGQGSRK